jgi:hypothetical protein
MQHYPPSQVTVGNLDYQLHRELKGGPRGSRAGRAVAIAETACEAVGPVTCDLLLGLASLCGHDILDYLRMVRALYAALRVREEVAGWGVKTGAGLPCFVLIGD